MLPQWGTWTPGILRQMVAKRSASCRNPSAQRKTERHRSVTFFSLFWLSPLQVPSAGDAMRGASRPIEWVGFPRSHPLPHFADITLLPRTRADLLEGGSRRLIIHQKKKGYSCRPPGRLVAMYAAEILGSRHLRFCRPELAYVTDNDGDSAPSGNEKRAT
jgi:hypothetical protein